MSALPPPPGWGQPPAASGLPAAVPTTVPGVPPGVELGSIGDRFVGLILDSLVLLPVLIASLVIHRHHSHVVLVERFGRMRPRRTYELLPAWEALLLALPGFLYVTLLIGLRGRTLGQQARRLRVVRLDDAGAPRYARSLVRWAVVGLPAFLIALTVANGPLRLVGSGWTLLVLGWMFFDKRRQGLHDKAAGVLVVVDPR